MLQALEKQASETLTETSDLRSGALTTKEAAKVLGVNPSTLAQWRGKGLGPRWFRIDYRRCGYLPQDLEDWMHRRLASGGGGE